MKIILSICAITALTAIIYSCQKSKMQRNNTLEKSATAQQILGDPRYRAISYGGYRHTSREEQPTIPELKEDLLIMSAMGIRLLRTYNVHFAHAGNVLQAIKELKEVDPSFEMYVMLGAWINCDGAFSDTPNHDYEDARGNQKEIDYAVHLTNRYPDIVKIIAVGNEAMVKWAANYYVQPWVILKYVTQLQELKITGGLPAETWITSSDNFASWGGGEDIYHVPDLEKLAAAVDFISLHTYPMHDTHYNPAFWGTLESENQLSTEDKINRTMIRARDYAISQYDSTKNYLHSIGIDKPIHIGETGWASSSNGHYGLDGSKATDEYKEGLFHKLIREWTDSNSIACFYFEAFDEPWKDAGNAGGSENYFGLLTLEGQAKYALWEQVDQGVFDGLTRGGNTITKTYGGSLTELQKDASLPPFLLEPAHH